MELILGICLVVLCGVLGIWEYGRTPGSGKPYFKHISQAAAKAALGKRYVAPSADAP